MEPRQLVWLIVSEPCVRRPVCPRLESREVVQPERYEKYGLGGRCLRSIRIVSSSERDAQYEVDERGRTIRCLDASVPCRRLCGRCRRSGIAEGASFGSDYHRSGSHLLGNSAEERTNRIYTCWDGSQKLRSLVVPSPWIGALLVCQMPYQRADQLLKTHGRIATNCS